MNPLSSVSNALSSAASMVVEGAELAKDAVLDVLDRLGELLPDLPHSSKRAPNRAAAPFNATPGPARTASKRPVTPAKSAPTPSTPVAVVDVSEPKVARMSTSDAVVAALGKLPGPVSVAAIHTELQEMGRDELIGHIEAALPGLAKRNLVVKHGPMLWESAP